MKKICLATTSPLIVNFFLVPYINALKTRYQVALAVNTAEDTPLPDNLGIEVLPVAIERKIAPRQDLSALLELRRLFVARQFNAVHSFSPKAGLLCTLAGRSARVPVRIHTFTGQIWATRRGPMRFLLRSADRATARAATHLLADSSSQRDFLVQNGIVRDPTRCRVLGAGSVSGVDTARFRPDSEVRGKVRSKHGISEDSVTFLFLGRLTRDKGVLDLARAFAALPARGAATLMIVGPDEDDLRPEVELICRDKGKNLVFAGYTRTPEHYLAAADVLCLPSYREGFGTAIIEAAAAGIPAIGSDIYGIRDAVVADRTGLLHPPGDIGAIGDAMERMLADPALRLSLGRAAKDRAIAEFSESRLTEALLDFYREVLGE